MVHGISVPNFVEIHDLSELSCMSLNPWMTSNTINDYNYNNNNNNNSNNYNDDDENNSKYKMMIIT